jgi:hypothetical protein
LPIGADEGTRQKSGMQDTELSEKATHLLSLYPKIFDYSLGGYYHRERWARTRRYYQNKLLYDDSRKDNLFEPILKKAFLTIASGATPIGSAGRAPDKILKMHKESREVIRPFCITILYYNLLLFIDIFHI